MYDGSIRCFDTYVAPGSLLISIKAMWAECGLEISEVFPLIFRHSYCFSYKMSSRQSCTSSGPENFQASCSTTQNVELLLEEIFGRENSKIHKCCGTDLDFCHRTKNIPHLYASGQSQRAASKALVPPWAALKTSLPQRGASAVSLPQRVDPAISLQQQADPASSFLQQADPTGSLSQWLVLTMPLQYVQTAPPF